MKIFTNPNAQLKSKFGEYQIAVLGNIVAVSAEGTASKSAIARYSQDMIEVISGFQGGDWAFLGFLHGAAMLTPDAESELQKSIEWRAGKGMKLGALVTGRTTIEGLVKSQFERIYRKAGVKLGIFSTEEQAVRWLAQQGFMM
ncbi:hypothetical protein [Alteromonas sp. CYL-A6]|uniref:hypothetical protein n=1 Tax=Alteromonas nitratireducens TaxID=3390813 RepID=UPI0034BC5693